MFRSLNSRLLLSYVTIILVCLALVGLGLFLFVRTSPLWTRMGMGILQLEATARATMPLIMREGQPEGIPLERTYALLAQVAAAQEGVRILTVDSTGRAQFDSADEWVGINLSAVAPQRPLPQQGVFTAPDGQRWAYIVDLMPVAGGRPLFIMFASPMSPRRLVAWFVENLFPPLMRAGLVALVLSVLLAWLVTRSVSRPLQRVVSAVGAIARGDLEQRAPVSGPQEVRDLARAFNQMVARVAAAQQVQRDFVANVSHELKTPLTSIQGFSQAILDGTAAEPETVERAAHIIHDEAERMRRMVDELLSLARFDAGQVQMTQEPVDLGALLARCVERLAPQAEAAGDELLLSAPEGLFVNGDADWLTQVFVNLLDNAIRHTRDGRVEVTAHRTGDWIEAAVTDTGEGIPSQELGRIFERFYRADKSRRRKGGVGLGLPIVREVVRLHGGDVTAESVLGLGSRFTVRLPAREGNRAKTEAGRRTQESGRVA